MGRHLADRFRAPGPKRMLALDGGGTRGIISIAFLKQIENFAGAIRGEEELLITASDGIASVEAVEAAYRALHNKEFQPVSMAAPAVAA